MLLYPSPLSKLQDFTNSQYEQRVHFFSAIVRLIVIPFLEKLLAEAFLEFKNLSVCQALERGVRSWKNKSVLSCAAGKKKLVIFFTAALLLLPSSLLADFPFKHLPHLRILWKFSCVWRRCVFQSVLRLFSDCGDVFKVSLPFCLML